MSSRPVTAPPLNATCKAALSPLCAACAVRTLARTATTMPTYPAVAEATAPMRKPTAVNNPNLSDQIPAPHRTMNNAAATYATVVYCRLRYAFAPSWIAFEMLFILSDPSGNFRIHRIK